MRNGGAYMLWLELSEAAAKKRQKSRRPAGITVPLAFCLYQTPSGVLGLSREAMSNRSISSIGICIFGSAPAPALANNNYKFIHEPDLRHPHPENSRFAFDFLQSEPICPFFRLWEHIAFPREFAVGLPPRRL